MGLVGRYSNRELIDKMRQIEDRLSAVGHQSVVRLVATPRLRRPPGEAVQAIISILACGEELSAGDIHLLVESLLGEAVPVSTVKNCLARNARGTESVFERSARGRYRLRAAREASNL